MKESATFITSASITVFLTGFIIITHDLSAGFRESLADVNAVKKFPILAGLKFPSL